MKKSNLFNFSFIILAAFVLLMLVGCDSVKTEGILEIKGKVIDNNTKTGIPLKNIIVQGLVIRNDTFMPIESGQFSTDSSGSFTYLLRKIKDAKNYKFCFVGDSENLFTTSEITLFDLETYSKDLSFSLSKLVDLTITLNRKSKTPVYDTLCLSWESDDVYFWFLYPYRVTNNGKAGNSFGPKSDMGLTWIGSEISSTISTKVFAEKRTKLRWELYRDGKKKVFTDTITCKRDFANTVYFTY